MKALTMEKKEYYKHMLPHFQQPGQAYFVTWSLRDAIPPKALKRYSADLENIKAQLNPNNFGSESTIPLTVAQRDLLNEYHRVRKKYIRAYNDLLDLENHSSVNLVQSENRQVMLEALSYWHLSRLENYAFCIMPNHVHWVFRLFETTEQGKPVYLQDVLYSVKRFTARKINILESRTGALWQKESFDTTIRDMEHLHFAIEYTLNNPVSAGFVKNWAAWKGSYKNDAI
ncbi:Transposase IS200 like [Sunxiuqinia elliptica]|uniref:Transposase IS200 like n=2 Tax=Sunxiuqinia elliptica TaxID=655355 RepID=A0A1I2C6N0_9BACT|nr:Transposase IS200 like [Sunxiuqinia elliptica]